MKKSTLNCLLIVGLSAYSFNDSLDEYIVSLMHLFYHLDMQVSDLNTSSFSLVFPAF